MAFTELYVSKDGAGAHNGTSEANAWTFAEMIAAAPAAGSRVNIKYSATYSQGTTTLPSSGTAAAPIVLRGYHTTIGDLDAMLRLSTGPLDITNGSTPFPLITITGLWTPSPYCILQNLSCTGALSSYLIGSTAADRWGLVNCSVVNTQNNAAAGAVQLDDYCVIINCDLSCTGASHSIVLDADVALQAVGCRIVGTLNTANLLAVQYGNISGCTFLGMGNTSVAIAINSSGINPTTIDHCTFYNFGTVISRSNNASAEYTIVTNCHITDCTTFIANAYEATALLPTIGSNNRFRDVTNRGSGHLETTANAEVTTDTGDYTTDYISATNLALISTAAGVCKGMIPFSDIGSSQHAYPILPAESDVLATADDYGYADDLQTGTASAGGGGGGARIIGG